MDIKETLKLHMNYIVGCFYKNVGSSDDKIMDEMYTLIENDIDINFDSKHFYLLRYELIEKTALKFDIDLENTPRDLLKMILKLIELQRMEQNIKNKLYLIHFRGFKGKVYLEDVDNTLRIEAFLQLHNYLVKPFINIRVFLIKKLLELNNKLKTTMEDEEQYINYKVQVYRIKAVLKAIESRTSLLT